MSFSDLIALLTAAFKFPDAFMEFVRLLKATPEEKHADLIKAIQDEKKTLDQTGRPSWH